MNRAGLIALLVGGVIVGGGVGAYTYLSGAPPPNPNKRGCDLTMSPRVSLTRGVSGTAQTMTFSSMACSAGTVTVAHNGTTVGTCSLSSGSCTYADTLPDMATTTITGSITSSGVTHSDRLLATVDSLNPEISLTSPGLAGDGTLVVVSGLLDQDVPINLHVENGDPGYYPDDYPGTDGGGHLTVTAVVLGGADGGSLVTRWKGTPLAATALTTSPQTVTQHVVLPEGDVGVLSIAATIGSGAYTVSVAAMVDTLIPPTPTIYFGVPVATDGGCAGCGGGSSHSPNAAGQACSNGCLYTAPPNGAGWTHIVDERHADFDVAAVIPPDSGLLWGETQVYAINSTYLSQVSTPQGDGGYFIIEQPDGGGVVVAAQWFCAHHYSGCTVAWSP